MRKILIIQNKMIGDVLTSTILLETLRNNFPKAVLHYLVQSHTSPVLLHHPHIDKLLLLPSHKHNRRTWLKQIKDEKYDVVIDAYSKINSALITFYSKAPVRIGLKKSYLRIAYTHSIINHGIQHHNIPLAFENRLRMLQPLEVEIDFTTKPKIYIHDEEQQAILHDCREKGINLMENNFLMISLLGSDSSKTYPLEYMAKLLDFIVEKHPRYRLFLNYMPQQQADADIILSQCRSETRNAVLNFYTKELRDFIVLTSFCQAIIGNEGGAVNMAKAVQVPTFAIFSPWITTEGWGASKEDVLNKTIHLKEIKPELYNNYKKSTFRKSHAEYYRQMIPENIYPKLNEFLNHIQQISW